MTASTATKVEVLLAATRPDAKKKYSWRLSEVGEDPDDLKIGDVYVPKTTLMELGWKEGDALVLTLEVRS